MKPTLKHIRKISTLLFFICLSAYAQIPHGFNYQATIRNSSGELILNQSVNIRISILQNAQTSTPIYTETHNAQTDNFGQINLIIGSGTTTLGTFSNINWGNGACYLSIEMNANGTYIGMGVKQLMSVPYALYAKNVGNVCTLPNGATIGDVLSWNGTTWVPTSASNLNGLPAVATITATSITGISAQSGGAIAIIGVSSILSKGVCWSTNPNPTTNNSITTEGSGNINFISTLSNLIPGTVYFYRAYAISNVGTGYGATYSFTTNSLPVISSNTVTLLTNSSAQSGGFISSDGGSAVTGQGIVWNTNPNPTIDLTTKTNDVAALGSFISNATGLLYNTTYYIRAYATNTAGTGYGAQQQFTTINYLSPNLEFTFNYDQPLAIPGTTGLTLYNVNAANASYDMDYLVLDASFNDTFLYEAASNFKPEKLIISDLLTNPNGSANASYLADGTYYIFYSLYSDATLSTLADFTPINVPTTVDYLRQGSALSGTFVQEAAFVPNTQAAPGASNFVISFTKLNGIFTLNNSVPQIIASGRFSKKIKEAISKKHLQNRKPQNYFHIPLMKN
jgi:hypothetical protein